MDIIQFADRYIGRYKKGTTELQVHKCPFCGREKGKFYINTETGYFFCHSGSCNARGDFNRLKEHFGLKEEVNFTKKKLDLIKKSLVNYISDDFSIDNPEMKEFFNGKGISEETLKENCILWSKKRKAVTFLLTDGLETNETGQTWGKKYVVGIRYRVLPKQYSVETGSKLILFGLDQYPKEETTCFITEGETDFLTLKEIGYKNCVSMPSGCSNFDWVEYNKKFLSGKDIILCLDNDDAGIKATNKAFEKLKGVCNSVKTIVNNTTENDLNDIYRNYGITTLIQILDNPIKQEVKGIKNITDIGRFKINEIERIKLGIKGLDVKLRGAKETELIVIGGDNSSGKTTLMSQFILQTINQGKKVYFYNGELGEEFLKYWLLLQASGGNGVERIEDKQFGVYDYTVNEETYKKIDEWLDKKLFITTDGSCSNQNEVMERMKSAYENEKCFLFVLDNLSSINFTGEDKETEMQGKFIAQLKDFAKQRNVCVLVVTHVTKERNTFDKKSIKGSGKVTDLADTVLLIEKKDTKDDFGKIIKTESKIHIVKNRFFGMLAEIKTGFNYRTKRIFDLSNAMEEEHLQYGWETLTEDERAFFKLMEEF